MSVDTDTKPLQFTLSPDPVPGDKPSRSQKAATKRGRPSNESKRNVTKKEIEDQVAGMIALIGVPLSMKDPHCGGALVENRKPIAEALADIAMDNDWLKDFLTSGGDIMKYMKLATALMPVGITIYQHHIVRYDVEGGVDDQYIGDGSVE